MKRTRRGIRFFKMPRFFPRKSEGSKHQPRMMVLTVVASVLTTVLQAQQLTLVENGRALSAIVVEQAPEKPPAGTKPDPKEAHPYERYEALVLEPARDIQDALRKMSGAEVPLITEGAPLPGGVKVLINVGRTAAARKAGVKFISGCDFSPRPDAFEEEGYVLHSTGGNIYIVGNQDGFYAGTAYGCYAFLERLGCRWYFPGAWGEVIPSRTTVEVGELNVESRPDFAVRSIWISGWTPTTPAEQREFERWMLKVGLRPGGRLYGSLYLYPLCAQADVERTLFPLHGRSGHRDPGQVHHGSSLCRPRGSTAKPAGLSA